MTNALLEKEKAVNSTIANYNNNKENIENGILNDNSIEFHQMTSIQQAKYVEKKLDDTCAKLTDVALGVSNRANISDILNKGNSTENNELKTPTKDASNVPFVSKTPSYARSGIKNISSALKSVGVPGTPAARPFNWLVKQAASEVKLLRQRTEQLYLVEIDKENVQNGGNSQLTENDASIANSNMNIHEYKRQLQEALQVIYEQDRLIHAGMSRNICFYLCMYLNLIYICAYYVYSSSW
jgi:PPE-repeat protein